MMKRTITCIWSLLLCLPSLLPAQQREKITVFDGSVAVGYLGDTTNRKCTNCHTIREIQVYNQTIKVTLPVSVISINGSSNRFFEDYTAEKQLAGNETKLSFQNSYGSENYCFTFSANNGGRLLSVQRTMDSRHRYAIAKNDYTDLPATKACIKMFAGKAEPIPKAIGIWNFKMPKGTDCFDFPPELTVEKAINMRQNKIRFKWVVN